MCERERGTKWRGTLGEEKEEKRMFCSYYCISYWYRRQQHTPAERLKQDATRVSLAVVPCYIVCVTVSVAPCWNTTCLLCLCWSLNGSIPFPHTSRPAYIINKILKRTFIFLWDFVCKVKLGGFSYPYFKIDDPL